MRRASTSPTWVAALLDKSLSPIEFRVLVLLMRYQGRHDSAWPSQETLAADLGMSVEGVRRIIKRLVAKGWVGIIRPAHTCPGRNNEYVIHPPANHPPGQLGEHPPGQLGVSGEITPPAKPKSPHRPSSRIKGRRNSGRYSSTAQARIVAYDWTTYAFGGISEDHMQQWGQAYPNIDVEGEIKRAAAWCRDNEEKARGRTDWSRFLGNWLAKAQRDAEAAGRTRPKPPHEDPTPEELDAQLAKMGLLP